MSIFRRRRDGDGPEFVELPVPEQAQPIRFPADALRAITAAAMPALIRHGSVSLVLGIPRDDGGLPSRDAADAAYYANPEHLRPVGPARKRQPRPRTFACPHMSIGNVVSASCGTCGPLRAAA